jgi:rhodanese-related sulfurtransferase
MARIAAAEKSGCVYSNGAPLLTIIDFRAAVLLKDKIGGDRYHVRTTCSEIIAQLDDFIDNASLIDRIPRKGFVVCISETGKRDQYLQRYLHILGFTNVVSLENGMRGWLKAGYPTEELETSR